jgi:hypothetical protein
MWLQVLHDLWWWWIILLTSSTGFLWTISEWGVLIGIPLTCLRRDRSVKSIGTLHSPSIWHLLSQDCHNHRVHSSEIVTYQTIYKRRRSGQGRRACKSSQKNGCHKRNLFRWCLKSPVSSRSYRLKPTLRRSCRITKTSNSRSRWSLRTTHLSPRNWASRTSSRNIKLTLENLTRSSKYFVSSIYDVFTEIQSTSLYQ